MLAKIDRAGRGGGGSRMQQENWAPHAFGDVLHETIGQHHQEGAGEAGIFEHLFQRIQIAAHRRSDIGADRSGVEAFELTPDRQRLVRGGDEDVGRYLINDFGGTFLVGRIGIRMQEADRDRLDTFRLELAHRLGGLLLVQRRCDLTIVQRTLVDTEAAIARDQRFGRGNEQIVERDILRLHGAPQFNDVAEILGGQHAGLGAAPGQQDVGGKRCAVHQDFDLAEEFIDANAVMACRLLHCVHEALGGISGRRRCLKFLQQAGFIHHEAVSECAADVDADAFGFSRHQKISSMPPL